MTMDYVPLISAFVGALIGGASSIGTILVSSIFENRRQLNRLAYEAALEDHKAACDLAKHGGGPSRVAPLTSYIHFHVEYMKLIKKGKLSVGALKKLQQERDQLFADPQSSR